MEKFLTFFIPFLIIIIIYTYYKNGSEEVTYVTSDIDNKKYLVQNLPDKKEASNMLALVNQKLNILVKYLSSKYPTDERIKRLNRNYNPDYLMETDSNSSKYTSYSINKGEKVVLCMRSRNEKKQLEGLNTLLFVALHELSHILTKSIGHTDEFWDNFKFVLVNAVKTGVYKKQDFNKNPVDYCGTKITDTPLNN